MSKQWEYCRVHTQASMVEYCDALAPIERSYDYLATTLGQLGQDGWKLVGVDSIGDAGHAILYLRRRRLEDRPIVEDPAMLHTGIDFDAVDED